MDSLEFTVEHVEKPSDSMLEEAIKIFCDLVPEDPMTISLIGGDPSLTTVMARAMIKPQALVSGEMYAAMDKSGTLVGFTLWLRPGRDMYDFEGDQETEMGLDEFKSKLSDGGKYFDEVLGKEFPKVIDSFTGIEDTPRNTYWCNFAFVRADWHGKGVAKAMFTIACEKAKEIGVPLGLVTANSRNLKIYERMGFELKGHKLMSSPWRPWDAWVFLKETKTP